MNISIVNPAETSRWDDAIKEFPESTFFHTSAWARLILDTYNYSPLYLIASDNGHNSGCMPLMEIRSIITGTRAVSLPFSDFCQPLVQDEKLFDAFLDYVTGIGRKKSWKYIELKGIGKLNVPEDISLFDYHHSLELTDDIGTLFSRFSSNTRRNIKKAEKENLQVEAGDTINLLNEFYKLNCITRKRHGLPPQPYKFFRNFYNYILAEKLGTVINVKYENKVIASAVYLFYKDKVIYKFGASDMNYQNLRANNLVMWKAICWSAEKGFKKFSFGKTEAENEGLRRFKLGWNTSEEILYSYRIEPVSKKFIPVISRTSGSHTKLFSRMPVFISKILGKLAYRHIG
ncbi:MAG: hypothetical protein Kow0098_16600 [Ignavibacteriaceae bacterium]